MGPCCQFWSDTSAICPESIVATANPTKLDTACSRAWMKVTEWLNELSGRCRDHQTGRRVGEWEMVPGLEERSKRQEEHGEGRYTEKAA